MRNKLDYKDRPSPFYLPGPVAVGGVGGSGTRVLFRLLTRLGFYMGRNLNRSGDNLWFTVLFKQPHRFTPAPGRDPGLAEPELKLFEKLMTTNDRFTAIEAWRFFQAACQLEKIRRGAFKKALPRTYKAAFRPPLDFRKYRGWGWKEPNSLIFIQALSHYFKDLKFILVLRHGLDMAYSDRNQFRHWARLLGLEQQAWWPGAPIPVKKLEYWLAANRFALDQGKRFLGDRFMVIHLETLCDHPIREINRLLDFLGLESKDAVNPLDFESLYRIPRSPATRGRFRNHDPALFSRDQLDAVARLGYPLADES